MKTFIINIKAKLTMHLIDNLNRKLLFLFHSFIILSNFSFAQNSDSCLIFSYDSNLDNSKLKQYNCILFSDSNKNTFKKYDNKTIDKTIESMENLNSVYFYTSRIKKTPNSIIHNKNIKNVYVYDDFNGDIASCIYYNFWKIDSLERIEIVSRDVKIFPEKYYQLKKLKSLHIANLSSKSIFKLNKGFDNLEELMLSGEKLELEEPSIFNLKRLNYLRLEILGIREFQKNFMKHSKIEVLDLSFLREKDFNTFFELLEENNIKKIVLSSTLNNFPDGIYKLSKLVELSIRIKSLKLIDLEKIKNLNTLSTFEIHLPADYIIEDELTKIQNLLKTTQITILKDL